MTNRSSCNKTIAILGGGPAGSATALSLIQSLATAGADHENTYDIHIFNHQRNTPVRVGESIPPAATPVLKRLGVADIIEQGDIHIDCPGSISLWDSDTPGHNDFLFDIVGQGYHLDRQTFDAQLLSKAKNSGIIFHDGWKLTDVNQAQDQHELIFSVEGSEPYHTINADFVVDATGKSAAFARRLEVCRNVLDDVTFLCTFVDLADDENISSHTYVEAVAEGWWYAARLPNNKMIITFCSDKQGIAKHHFNQAELWLQQLKQTQWVQKNIPQSLLTVSANELELMTQSAPSSLLSAVGGDNWLAVGDAASSCDPITSAGITKALIQGEQAGIAIAKLYTDPDPTAIHAYQHQVFSDFKQYAAVRTHLYRSETRFTDSGFWQRRLGE